MAQPASLYLSRQLVRVMPFGTDKTFVNGAAGAGSTFVAEFDVALVITDANQLLTGAFPGGAQPQSAVGPLLDAVAFTTGAGGGSILTEYAVDRGAAYRAFSPIAVASATLINISGLRITARFVRVTFTNVTAGATVEFGVYVRSS